MEYFVSAGERKLKLASDELQIVWGEVYIPDVPDSDGDFMTAEDIREMAYNFLRKSSDGRLGNIDVCHNNRIVKGCSVVESYIARKGDPDGFVPGAWVVGVHVPDKEVWGAIKRGELNGFSMEALVTKTPVEIELEIPPIISGRTYKHGEGDSQHDHAFHVAYDERGNFLGGRTDIVNGHYHRIKRGTVSEEAAGHRHKFAVIDSLLNATSS
jgi:hypothetical protein